MKGEHELINEAEENFGPLVEGTANPGMLLAALEAISSNGESDAHGGDVESPTGFFYRVDRWIVTVDSLGFKHVADFPDEDEAKTAYEDMEREYVDWAGEDS